VKKAPGLLLLLGLLILLTGCSKSPTSPSTDPTATPVPGGGNIPTATPNRTATAIATPTPSTAHATATPTIVVTAHNVEYIVNSSDLNYDPEYVGTDYLPHLVMPAPSVTTWSSGLITKYTKDMLNLTVFNGNAFSITVTLTIKEDNVIVAQSPMGGTVIGGGLSSYIECLTK